MILAHGGHSGQNAGPRRDYKRSSALRDPCRRRRGDRFNAHVRTAPAGAKENIDHAAHLDPATTLI